MITESSKKQITEAVKKLLGMCDGAHSRDNSGFNKFDAEYLREVGFASEYWEEQTYFILYKKLKKYQKQLEKMGIVYSEIESPYSEKKSSGNKVWYDFQTRRYQIVFGYDPKIVSAVKCIPEKKWNNDRKVWTVPYSQKECVKIFIDGGNFSVVTDKEEIKKLEEVYGKDSIGTSSVPPVSAPVKTNNVAFETIPPPAEGPVSLPIGYVEPRSANEILQEYERNKPVVEWRTVEHLQIIKEGVERGEELARAWGWNGKSCKGWTGEEKLSLAGKILRRTLESLPQSKAQNITESLREGKLRREKRLREEELENARDAKEEAKWKQFGGNKKGE